VAARDAEIARAVEVLRAGGLVAFPTETVYGLGADAASPTAVHRLFAVKGRPSDHPVIVHLGDAAQLDDWAVDVPDSARTLARACWPGPLTVVVRRDGRVPDAVTGGLETVGLRVPDQPVALALLRSFGGGVAAPSANRFGRVSPTSAADVWADLGDDVDVVLDGGECAVGVESTVLDLSGATPVLLRPGGVTREALTGCIGPVDTGAAPASGPLRSPGMLTSHYAPSYPVRLDARSVAPDEGVLSFGPPPPNARHVFPLSEAGDTTEAAARLFEGLRQLDATPGLRGIAVMPIPNRGLGHAINDRLRRAAAPRNRA